MWVKYANYTSKGVLCEKYVLIMKSKPQPLGR